jgi:hypothetical protein
MMHAVLQFGIIFIVETALIYSVLASTLEMSQMLLLSLLLAGMATFLGIFLKTSPVPMAHVPTKTTATETTRALPDSMYRRKPSGKTSPSPEHTREIIHSSTIVDFSDCF